MQNHATVFTSETKPRMWGFGAGRAWHRRCASGPGSSPVCAGRSLGRRVVCVLSLSAVVHLTGCGLFGPPPTADITLPDGETVVAPVDSGAPSLANSEWSVHRAQANGQAGQAVVTLVFDANGGIDRFTDSTIATTVFGDEIILDGATHGTTQAGLTYTGMTFGAENDSGFAFESRITALFFGLEAATASATATGTFVDGDPNTMVGMFEFVSHAAGALQNSPIAQQAEQQDAFDFVALRITG
ncbi:MAG: hypothetical protein ACE5E6_01370 [Phycisphaerae bacterium]